MPDDNDDLPPPPPPMPPVPTPGQFPGLPTIPYTPPGSAPATPGAPTAPTPPPAQMGSPPPLGSTITPSDQLGIPGYETWETEVKKKGGGGAGAAAAAAGGSRSAMVSKPAPMFGQTEDDQIKAMLDNLMSGRLSMFPPEVLEMMKAELFQAGQGRVRAGTDEIYRDAIRRGVGRGGIPAEGVAGLQRTVASDYSKGVRDILIKKAQSDIELKLKGLDAMQRWLDSRRQYVLQSERNAIDKEIGLANIRLGYARIDAEREMLTMQLNARGGGGGGPDWSTILQLIGGLTPPPPPPGV